MNVTMMCLNQSILQLYQRYKKSLGKGSGWIIDSVIDHNISISKYNPLAGSSYIKLSKELDHPRKGLINIQNTDDNDCFKWCLVRYVAQQDLQKILPKSLILKTQNFQLKLETLTKLKKKKNSIGISVFGYENK